MNTFNRVLVVFLLLIAIMLCTFVLVVPVPVLNAIAQQSALLADLLDFEWYTFEWFMRIIAGICFALLLDIILLFFLVLEVRQPRKAIRVEKAAGGEVLISITSIADRMKHEVGQLPNVLRTKPKVSGKRKGIEVKLDVEAEAGVNVPEKAEQIVQVARRVVEEDMGLKLARPPRVNLRVAPYSKGYTPPKTSPAAPEVVPAVEPEDWSPVEPAEAEEELPNLPEDFEENF